MAIGAVNPLSRVASGINKALSDAGEKTNQAVDGAISAAFLPFISPEEAIKRTGNFASDAVSNTINAYRNSFASGWGAANFVIDVLDTPCEDKWTVVVQTALPAAGDALTLLAIPQPKEILEEYLNPKEARRGRRASRKRRGLRRLRSANGKIRRRFPRPPNIDELIAARLPGSHAIQGRRAGRGDIWIFEGIDIVDRVLWYWLLLEVNEQFWYSWSSQIMQAQFCSRPWDGIVHWQGGFTTNDGAVRPMSFVDGEFKKEKNVETADASFDWQSGGGQDLAMETTALGILEAKCEGDFGGDGFTIKPRWRVTFEDTSEELIEGSDVTLKSGETRSVTMNYSGSKVTSIFDVTLVERHNDKADLQRISNDVFAVGRIES